MTFDVASSHVSGYLLAFVACLYVQPTRIFIVQNKIARVNRVCQAVDVVPSAQLPVTGQACLDSADYDVARAPVDI